MQLKIERRDLFWGYFAQIFSITSGIIVLPTILKLLSPEEVGFNYIMLTIGAFVTLFDFGFAPQFGRNITYVFSGSQTLLKEGVDYNIEKKEVNYRLLYLMIKTAKYLYRRLAILVLVILLFGGTFYVYNITNGFITVENSFSIWVLYCISIYFNIYYAYYSSLLNGKGMVTEYRKSLLYSKFLYTILCLVLLYCDLGLISLVLANLASTFLFRFLAFNFFFSKGLKSKISMYKVRVEEIKELLEVVWHNARKLGLVYLGSFTITKVGMFMAGLYLSLEDIASYGLMIQLITLIIVVSTTVSSLYQPRIASLQINDNKNELLKDFSFTVFLFIIIYLIGVIVFLLIGPKLLELIGSLTLLPSKRIIVVFAAVMFLETNHSLFSSFIVTKNKIPFVKATLISGLFISIFSFLVLQYTDFGILGIVVVPGVIQLLYNNWKWPYVVCKSFNISYYKFILIGGSELINKIKLIFYKNIK